MSGGAFDYKQHHIRDIYEEIQSELSKQGKEKAKEEMWNMMEYYEKYPEERFNTVHRADVQKIMKEGVMALKIAEVYAQRIDWYLSGDDGEDSLAERLKSDLDRLT